MTELQWDPQQRTRRDFLRIGGYAGVGIALSAALAACSSGSQPASGTEAASGSGASGAGTAASTGTLTFGQGTGPANLDPLGPGLSTPLISTWRQMYDTLVWWEDGKIVPQLATSWKLVDDLTWEFTLRKGVTFHNGEPFDASAVKFTMDRILDPAQKATQAARFTAVDKTEVVDASTVRIHTTTPFPVLLIGLTQAFIVAPKYVGDTPDQAKTHPVGTGPFAFDSWKQGDNITFAANPAYWDGAPSLAKLVFRVIADDSTRLAALQAGEIDIDMNLPLDNIASVSSAPNLTEQHVFIQEALVIEFDTVNDGPMANPLVRQAINYAVDKDELIKTLLDGTQRPLDGQLMPPDTLGYNKALKAFTYDPDKAKQLLAQAGYPDGFDTTINGPIGKYTADRDLVVAIAAQLQKVGIRATPNPMEYSLFISKLSANQLGPMFLIGWYSFGDPALSAIWFTSKSTLGQYYNDPKYDELVFKASGTVDTDERQKLYEQSSQYMHDQAMALFLTQPETYYGVNKRVSGFTPRDDEIAYFYPTSVS